MSLKILDLLNLCIAKDIDIDLDTTHTRLKHKNWAKLFRKNYQNLHDWEY